MADACSKCKARLNERTSVILNCDLCNGKYHLACSDLSKEQQKFYSTSHSAFTCMNCKLKFRNLLENNGRLLQENSQLRDENTSLRSRLDSMEQQLRNLKSEIKNEIISELKHNSSNSLSRECIRTEISSFLSEAREIEKRKLNLCVRNLPEATNDINDLPKLKEFLSSKLDLNETEVNSGLTQLKRLGERTVGKNRIIIVTCENSEIRRKMLQNATKLKDFRTPENKKVFINPDMTKLQMEENMKLNDELWRRRNDGERVIIRRGEIVSVSSRNVSERND